MNYVSRIVRAGDLPADLRGDIDPATLVRVTVQPDAEAERRLALEKLKAAMDSLSDEAERNGLTEEMLAEILAEAKAERIAARERGER